MSSARIIVLLLFFLSGASGLVYEVIWTRQLSLIFGISVFAVSTVLAAYMGGLALGSFLFGRVVDRHENPVRTYAWLEIGVGLSALAIPFAFDLVEIVYVAAAPSLEGNFLLFNFFRGLLAILPLLVPTTLMGGTVPAMARFLVRHPGEFGWSTALLYAVNTFGAVAGCAGAGFLLIPVFPLTHIVYGAVILNIGIGVLLLLGRVGEGSTPLPEQRDEPAPPLSGRGILAITVFGLSGFAALGFEILWTRTLVVHIHNSTYAFTLMLSTFLAGLALGDALMMRFYDRLSRPLLWLGVVQLGVGLSAVAAAAAYASLRSLSLGILGIDALDSWGLSVSVMAVRAGFVLLPSTVLLGMTFPLVVRVVCGDMRSLGRHLGITYGSNTVGAICGSLGTGFVLIPLLGIRDSLVLLSGLSVVLGTVCVMVATPVAVRRLAVGAGCALLLAIPPFLIPSQLFVDAYASDDWKLIFYREGVTDATGVYENLQTGGRFVTYGDQRGTSGTFTASVAKREAHLAHLLHPDPRRSLQIGFGVGNTLAAAVLYPEVEVLDCVELSSHIPDTAPFFWTNENVLANEKVRLIVDDGRNFLLRAHEKYDVITLEPPEIFTAGVVNLYTREFYQLAYDALTDDGLVVNWIPTYGMGEFEAKMLTKAVLDVFPHTSLWYQGALTEFDRPLTNMLLVIGSKKAIEIDAEVFAQRMSEPGVARNLREIGNPTPGSLLWHYIAGPERISEWVADVDASTDDHTVVDFTSPMLAQAGYGFGIFRVFEGLKGTRSAQARNDVLMYDLFTRLREPMDDLVLEGPGKEPLLLEIEAHRREFDGHVRELKALVRAASR